VTRRLVAICVLLTAVAPRATAQLPSIFPPLADWKDLWYPKLFWVPREGVTVGGYYALALPARYSDRTAAPQRFITALDGQISASGSRYVELDAWAPALVHGWRFRLTLAAKHWNREPYFGIGNATTVDSGDIAGRDLYYRIKRVRNFVRGEVQREIVGPVRVLAGWHAEHWFLDTIQANSQLATDLSAGADPRIRVGTSDISFRFGLVVDMRDREAAPRRGMLLEAIESVADSSLAGDLSYTRTTVSARGYLPVGERWGLAARVAGESMGGSPPLGTYFNFEASDEPFGALGGPESHRALYRYRFVDADKLLGNFELRYEVLPVPNFVRATLVGFVDAGRVFPPGEFRFTTDGLKVGGGAGVLLQLLSETAVLGFTTAYGPDGFTLYAHWKWPF
jgi:hypothetical protein